MVAFQLRRGGACAVEGEACECAQYGSVWFGVEDDWGQRIVRESINSSIEAKMVSSSSTFDEQVTVPCERQHFGKVESMMPKSCYCLPGGALANPKHILEPGLKRLAALLYKQVRSMATMEVAIKVLERWIADAEQQISLLNEELAEVESPLENDPAKRARNVVLGLAHLKDKGFGKSYKWFMSSLRAADPEVKIILGVSPHMMAEGSPALEFAQKQTVDLKRVEAIPCEEKYGGPAKPGGMSIRSVCVKEYPQLKMEWARFALFRDWLSACEDCLGWALVTDVRDTFFQESPFLKLGDPPKLTTLSVAPPRPDVFLIEEWNQFNSHWFSTASLDSCYGEDSLQPRDSKPMLCSGTLVGSREGLLEVLTLLEDEFMRNVAEGPRCYPPKCVDQAVLNYMYYEGLLGARTTTFKYGTGNVATVGTPCSRKVNGTSQHSLKDVVVLDSDGYILLADNSRAPVVHQYDRCHDWIMPILAKRQKAQGI
eukprot:TRINITY_DN14414_c0_g2_i6.p1 TRINITY_DN14414_c0_g2~~TRINITY_DN14414_c0_g2_i6.p1  ORF type:complete len:484 (-),score=55.77 TRINITY_DN14414_c0_g2_i6:143-1594(-)